jgi:hypothetical protein
MKFNAFLFFCLTIFAFACSGSKTPKSSQDGDYEAIAKKKFTDKFLMEQSPNGAFVVCFKDPKEAITGGSAENGYFIYDIKNKKIIKEENLLRGGVFKWENDRTLKITPNKEYNANTTGRPAGYLFDVIDMKVIKSSEKD